MQYRFEAVSQAQCDMKLREHCDDGLCWTVTEVFGQVTATSHATPRNVPRAPVDGSDLTRVYWQSGKWHNRRPATAAMERKATMAADRAAGVSDGGGVSDKTAVRRWFRARARKDAKRAAK